MKSILLLSLIHIWIDGKECLIVYNGKLHSIDILNLADRRPLKQIALAKDGPDQILAPIIDYAISLEGSLKLKEISYIHSEAYAAGELKHGTISLVEEGTLVAAVLTQKDLYKKTVSYTHLYWL